MSRLVRAPAFGLAGAMLALAASPLAAFATEEAAPDTASRALSAPSDVFVVALVSVLAVLALFAIASLGYLYRRERHLDWDFQQPDTPHDGGHH